MTYEAHALSSAIRSHEDGNKHAEKDYIKSKMYVSEGKKKKQIHDDLVNFKMSHQAAIITTLQAKAETATQNNSDLGSVSSVPSMISTRPHNDLDLFLFHGNK